MAKTAAQSEKASGAHNTLVRIVLRGAALGLVVVIACFVYLLTFDLSAHNQAQGQLLSSEVASGQAQVLNDWLQQLQFRLQAAADNPELLAAVKTPADDLPARQTALQRSFPEALSLRLIALGPLGIASLNDGAAGLRNNIEADMVRHASSGEHTAPEAYQFDKTWLISFAQPILATGDKYASGALMLTVPAKTLQQLLDKQTGSRGATALLQQVGSQSQPILTTMGSGDAQEFRQTKPLQAPSWQLQFTPNSTWLQGAQKSPWILLLMLGLSAIGILGGMLVCAKDIRVALERNLTGLFGAHELDLPGFTALRQQLQRKLQAAPVAPVATKKVVEAEAMLAENEAEVVHLPETIFRAYDIRGIADTQLTDAIVYQIALAIGSEALERGQQEVIVGRDGRASSPTIIDALIRGLRDSGRNVIDIGMVPTPVLYFATHQLGTQSGVMVTGSHNPAEYNGLKIVLAGKTLAGRAILALKDRIEQRLFSQGKGSLRSAQIEDQYVDYIANDVAIAQPLKIVIDAGNGVTGALAPRLFQELGCEVIPLYCDIDPAFPNHHPDPSEAANLVDLVHLVQEQGADLGIAFDGDGDRVGIVTASGAIVAADRLLMLLAQDVVSRNPGADVVFDVKCSRNLNSVISSFGGRPIMWKSGHSYMKEKMAETGALLGGEFSGHIFFNERWFGFDDGMYAAARLIEILSTTDSNLDNHLAALPVAFSTPELKIPADERAKFEIITSLAIEAKFGDGKITTLDGVRVDFPDGWGLVRASNTTPNLTLRFEADSPAALERIQLLFKEQLSAIAPQLQFGF